MKYSEQLRTAVAALEVERLALKAEADTLGAPDGETRTAEQAVAHDAAVEARATEIIARSEAILTEIADKTAQADSLDKLDEARATAPTFIRKPEKPAIDDFARMATGDIVESIRRSVGDDRDMDTTHVTKILKRHKKDRVWLENIAQRSTESYADAFSKLMTGRDLFLTNEERAAVAVGTNTQGGYLVPTHLDPTLILSNAGTSNAVRAISRVVTLTTQKQWNGVSTAGSDFSWDGELVEVSDDSPTFVGIGIPVFTGAGFIQASYQAFEDIDNLAEDVLMLMADGRDRLEGTAHCTGNGTTAPKGIFTACDANTNVEVAVTTTALIGLVDLQKIRRSVPVRFRKNSSFLMNPIYQDMIVRLGTALGASYTTNLTEAPTQRLLGSALVESDDAPGTITTTVKDNQIVVGDFKQYVIVDKPGSTTLDFIPNLFNTNANLPDGRRGWYMRFASGADTSVINAFRLLQNVTSA